MAKQIWKPGTLLAPVPAALVTCGTVERPNALTIAWTGIVCSDPAMTYISVRPSRHSYELIRESGEFAVNLVDRTLVRACDYCGVRSGAKEDKLAACGLRVLPGAKISAPVLESSPLSLECRVTQRLPLGSHDLFLAEIVAVDVEDRLLDASGGLRLDKADLVAYSHGEYFALGKKLGTFGYSVRKKPASPVKRKRPPRRAEGTK